MKNGQLLPAWEGAMTARQRFLGQMRREPVDRCFNREFGFWQENFSRWSIFRENGIADNAAADKFLGFDRMETAPALLWLNPAFKEEVIEETEDRKIIMNKDGLLAEIPADGHDSIPHFIKPSVSSPAEWEKCKEERLRRDDPAREVDAGGLKAAFPPDRDYPLGVNCGSMIGRIRDMLTFEGLAYACHDYPRMVEDMVETACVLVEDYLDRVLPCLDFDFAAGWEDIAYKNGPIVSLGFFRDVVVPRYRRISEKIRKAGIDIWYTDCDGDVRPLIPHFLEAGVNCMFPFEVNSSGHPGEVLKEHGPDLRIMGGVDKMSLAAGPGAISEYLHSLVPIVAEGGYIPFCDHRCPPNVKEEDYLYYLGLKKELFGMKKK